MMPFLLPRFCPKCGAMSFQEDAAGCTCPPESVGVSGADDAVLAEMLTRAMPLELCARNLRDLVRGEGLPALRAQIAELIPALEADVQAACQQIDTHRYVSAQYIKEAVANHVTKIVVLSGAVSE